MECPLIPDDDGDLRAIVSRSCNSLSATSSTIIPPSPPSSCLTHLPNTYYNSYCYTPELPNLATIHDIAWNHGQVPSPSSPSPPSSPSSSSSNSSLGSGTTTTIPTMKLGTRGTKRKAQEQHKRVVRVLASSRAPTKPGVGESNVPSDTWAWRKYGQKPIKGSPYPRGYYKCSTCKGCPARKQVERSVLDPTMLLLTYTGEHNHSCPTHRRDTLPSMPSTPSSVVVIDAEANVDENTSGCPIAALAHTNNSYNDEAQTQESLWYSSDPVLSALLRTHVESTSITNDDEEHTSLHGALFSELLEEMQRQSWSMEEEKEQGVVDEGGLGFDEVEDPFHLFSWSNNNCNMSCC